MKRRRVWLCSILVFCSSFALSQQQHPSSSRSAVSIPHLIKFGGVLKDQTSKPVGGVVGVTFALYRQEQGGAALWLETQNVSTDAAGRYTVFLGASKADGLPVELFTSGEARWLGVQAENQPEQPRVLLVAVPYALKAADAESLGGKPASAFVVAEPTSSTGTGSPKRSPQAASSGSISPAISGSGTSNFLARWTSSTNLGTSILFQSSINNLGIGTTFPGAKLDVRSTATTGANVALGAHVASAAGTAGSFDNSAGGKILSGRVAGVEKFNVDGGGNVKLVGSLNGGLRVQPTTDSRGNSTINIVGGFSGNTVVAAAGGTIGGGGATGRNCSNCINQVTSDYGTVGGGWLNTAARFAFVGGGASNTAIGNFATVGGGGSNKASGVAATVGGGDANTASGSNSTVCGGAVNTASGSSSMVLGGGANTAAGVSSFAAGEFAKALNDGSFVWGDISTIGLPVRFVSDTARNQFVVRSIGGAFFYSGVDSNGNPNAGVILAPGAGSWSNLSDRASKDDFAPVDGQALLQHSDAIPVTTWHYKAQAQSIRHLGPVAQDFRAAFGLGEDDKHISTVDADGVALAAIQALYRLNQEKDKKISELEQRLSKLEAQAK